LQYYGTSIGHVAAGNTSTRAGGFYNSGRWYHQYQPSWYCQFLGNRILDGNCYRFGPNNATNSGPSFLGTYGLQRGDNTAPLAYCSVHRGNVLANNSVIRLRGIDKERPGVRDVVVEHNTVRNASVGMQIDQGCVGVLVRENRFENVESERHDPEKEKAKRMAQRQELLDCQGPIYHQSFDEQHGRYFLDASGHKFVATQKGGEVLAEPGVAGQAGRFGGKGYLMVADRAMIRFPNTTLSAWVRPDQIKGRWGVVAKRRTGSASAFVMAIRNGTVCFEGTGTSGKWAYNLYSKPVLKSGWHHVAATCEEGRRVRVFYDGKLIADKAVDEPLVDNSQPLTIGFEAWGGPNAKPRESGNFVGLIDEVKIWSRCLNDEELLAEYEALREQAALAETRCREEERRREQELEAAKSGTMVGTVGVPWRLVQADEFSTGKIGSEWQSLQGRWQVKSGVLTCSETSFLGLAKAIKPPLRIEYRARSKTPSDLSAFVGSKGETFRDGYFLGFASNGNTKCKILKLG
ncbi:MAG: LamG domain-containing protein, partial [Victivallales bacterium]|nr:LamG domain-containing protein [Victivallales bacterium]